MYTDKYGHIKIRKNSNLKWILSISITHVFASLLRYSPESIAISQMTFRCGVSTVWSLAFSRDSTVEYQLRMIADSYLGTIALSSHTCSDSSFQGNHFVPQKMKYDS